MSPDKNVVQEKITTAVGAVAKVQSGKKPEMKHAHAHEDRAPERAEAQTHELEEIQEAVKKHSEKTTPHISPKE